MDRQNHARGKINEDRLVIDERHCDVSVFDQIVLGIADNFRRNADRLESFRIGKNVIFAVFVTEIHLPGIHRDDLDLFRRAEPNVGRLAGPYAPDARLHKSAKIAGSAVLCVQDNRDIAVVIDRHSFSNVVCCCHK